MGADETADEPRDERESHFIRQCPIDPEHTVSGFFADDGEAAEELASLLDEHVRAEHGQ